MMPSVSIVIPNWNGLHLLKQFLSSVISAANNYSSSNKAQTEIVVVDDASTDASVEWLIQSGFQIVGDYSGGDVFSRQSDMEDKRLILRLIRNEKNLGFGSACNCGIAAARNGLIFLLNNDVKLSETAIEPLVQNFADQSVFAVHCRVYDLRTGRECGSGKLGSFSRGFLRVHRSYTVSEVAAGSLDLISIFAGGGSSMYDRNKFMEIGGFDELFAPFYWEDVELSYRAWKRGYRVKYEPRSIAYHMISSTIGGLAARRTARIQDRNRLIFNWIHLHDPAMLAKNFLWVAVLGITAPLRMRFGFLASLIEATARIGRIRKRRAGEKRAAQRTDREILEIFRLFALYPEIQAFDDYSELEASKNPV